MRRVVPFLPAFFPVYLGILPERLLPVVQKRENKVDISVRFCQFCPL